MSNDETKEETIHDFHSMLNVSRIVPGALIRGLFEVSIIQNFPRIDFQTLFTIVQIQIRQAVADDRSRRMIPDRQRSA